MVSSSRLVKLGFLLNESLCSLKQVQQNVVYASWFYAPCGVMRYSCSPHRVPQLAPNEIDYGKRC